MAQFKLFLESIAYPEESDRNVDRKVDILKSYLDSQKPKDESNEEELYVPHIIQTWHFASEKKDDNLVSATASILALLLKTISTRIDFKDHGIGISRSILLPDQTLLVQKGLSALKNKPHIISPCTRLMTEITTFDGGAMGRQLYARKDQVFDPRTIARNLGIFNKPSEDPDEAKRRPSVRTNTIRYLMANLSYNRRE